MISVAIPSECIHLKYIVHVGSIPNNCPLFDQQVVSNNLKKHLVLLSMLTQLIKVEHIVNLFVVLDFNCKEFCRFPST